MSAIHIFYRDSAMAKPWLLSFEVADFAEEISLKLFYIFIFADGHHSEANGGDQ